MKYLTLILCLFASFVQGATHGAIDENDNDEIDRAPAVVEMQPEYLSADEERLIPYIDDSGTLNGSLHETFLLPEKVVQSENE